MTTHTLFSIQFNTPPPPSINILLSTPIMLHPPTLPVHDLKKKTHRVRARALGIGKIFFFKQDTHPHPRRLKAMPYNLAWLWEYRYIARDCTRALRRNLSARHTFTYLLHATAFPSPGAHAAAAPLGSIHLSYLSVSLSLSSCALSPHRSNLPFSFHDFSFFSYPRVEIERGKEGESFSYSNFVYRKNAREHRMLAVLHIYTYAGAE